MSKTTTKREKENTDLTADDLALVSAIILLIGDVVGLFAVVKARTESKDKD